MHEELFIGIDIGGTKTAVVSGLKEGGALSKRVFPSVDQAGPRSPESMIGDILEAILSLVEEPEALGRDLAAIGISCGGPLDEAQGLIVSPPNLPLWKNIPITSILSEATGVPAFLENDANACAVAEWREGAGRGFASMVFLTFGTGLGAGIIIDGKLWRGASGMAGELGHWRLSDEGPVGYGKEGSFEGWCSGGGMAQRIASRRLALAQGGGVAPAAATTMAATAPLASGPGSGIAGVEDVGALALLAREGDPEALAIFRKTGLMLGRGLALVVDFLNPEAIILGSIFARTKDLLWPPAAEALRSEALGRSLGACAILGAGLGEEIGDRAALWAARYGHEFSTRKSEDIA